MNKGNREGRKGAPARSEREKEKVDGVSQGRPVFFLNSLGRRTIARAGHEAKQYGLSFYSQGFLEWPKGQPIRYGSLSWLNLDIVCDLFGTAMEALYCLWPTNQTSGIPGRPSWCGMVKYSWSSSIVAALILSCSLTHVTSSLHFTTLAAGSPPASPFLAHSHSRIPSTMRCLHPACTSDPLRSPYVRACDHNAITQFRTSLFQPSSFSQTSHVVFSH